MGHDNDSPITSPSLLVRLRNPNDRESWKTFERVYGSIVRDYCRHWKLQETDIDDITQEVLSAVVSGIQNFKYDPARGRFRGWLGTITANRIKRLLRRKSNRRESNLPTVPQQEGFEKVWTDPDSDWVNIFSEQILGEACRNVRGEFEAKTWQCFEAIWVDQESPRDVAQSLGVAVHSVYVNKSRVLKRLEQEVRNLSDDLAFDFKAS